MNKKKLAIIGASELQNPLILKAKAMGIETHVFAWKAGAVGEDTADYFYPISIIEKEEILAKCREIGIDGITTIASDLATVAVCFVADAMGLAGNSIFCNEVSTNKHLMRERFFANGDPSPRSIMVETVNDLHGISMDFPLIVKPLDRSGSRGITKVLAPEELGPAIEAAKREGFVQNALVEEFAEGTEYSVEGFSEKGSHQIFNITRKFTTGAPHFIETGHIQPSDLSHEKYDEVCQVVKHALDSLQISDGASHSEVKISKAGNIKIIEIGGRMGGDFIGSHLVELSTGVDYLQAVVKAALGEHFETQEYRTNKAAAVRYILDKEGLQAYRRLEIEHPEYIVEKEIPKESVIDQGSVTDSSTRYGYFVMQAEKQSDLLKYLPELEENE